jgi:hypothetical protein
MPNVQPPTAVAPVPNLTPTILNNNNSTSNGIGINSSATLTNDTSNVSAVSSGYQPYGNKQMYNNYNACTNYCN